MKNIPKILLSSLLVLTLIFSFTACSKNVEMTEENVIDTVSTVEGALQNFDSKKLEKYVDSSTLSYIMRYADKHKQFKELGKAIFSDLTLEVKSVDVENKTVTVAVKNKDLSTVASEFVEKLVNRYSTFQLLQKLDDEKFLDFSLSQLEESMDAVADSIDVEVTLNVEQGDNNLVLSFDETAEDAVSGGALTAIKNIYS